jgi:phosphoribosyl-ATP pyrophosphohydrolase
MSADQNTLQELYATIAARKGADPETSYTAQLLSKGPGACAQKLGEEATETVVAALQDDREGLIHESADLLYHLLVLWALKDVTPADVFGALDARRGQSGLEEKASRKKK